MSVRNYSRFYALLNCLSCVDRDDMKDSLVSSFTDGRTTSLKEMTQKEYNAMCASLEERTGWREVACHYEQGRSSSAQFR